MSADGSVTLFWGDAEHRFRMAIGQFRELQENVNKRRLAIGAPPIGPMALLNSLRANDAWPDDVRDILRLGLNGGGMEPRETHRLLGHYFDGKPPLSNMRPAFVVLFAGLAGDPGDVAADTGAAKKKTETKTNPSASVKSTPRERQ